MMRLGLGLLLSLFALVPAQASTFDHAPWSKLLRAHVVVLRDGQATQVDYAGMAADRAELNNYLKALSSVIRAEFDRWPVLDQLAFLINAYNAWTVDLILQAYPEVDSIKDLGWLLQSPWKKRFVPLLGATRSLDEIEHELIRGSDRYLEPRIHFAVNCASIGCPALRPEAFVGARLDAQLETATRLFLSDRTRNRLRGDRLEVSSIFRWYREDFERGWRNAADLAAFLALYAEPLGLGPGDLQRLAEGRIKIRFLDYDWRLNGTL